MPGGARDRPVAGLTFLVYVMAVAGLADAQCTAQQFVAGIANATDLQTSAGLVNAALPIVGTPNNSTILLPTDAAWTAFRASNGAGAPDANRTVGILLYNSIISFGQASETLLVKSSPVQTSAAELLSDLANSTVILPLAFANVSSVVQATDVGGNTVNLTAAMNFCGTQVYSTSGVLLPAASYGAVPETYVADVAALRTLAASPTSTPAAAAAPLSATPTATPSAGGAAGSTTSPSSAASSPAPSSTAAPAPAPSAAISTRSASMCLLTLTLAGALLAAL